MSDLKREVEEIIRQFIVEPEEQVNKLAIAIEELFENKKAAEKNRHIEEIEKILIKFDKYLGPIAEVYRKELAHVIAKHIKGEK